jgi:hypothetical protein
VKKIKYFILISCLIISNVIVAEEVRDMEHLISTLNTDIKQYCQEHIAKINLDKQKEQELLKNSIKNNKSRYQLDTEAKSQKEALLHSFMNKKVSYKDCASSRKSIINNVFNQNYKEGLQDEFLNCYNEESFQTDDIISNFTNCIKEIKKKKCRKVLKEDMQDAYKRAMKYSSCLNE